MKASLVFDTRSMNRDIPIEDVIKEYSGISLTPRGEAGKANINCPSPEHQDEKPSARIYKDSNKCKCFTCNEVFNPIGLAKKIYPELRFSELCQKLINDFGLNIYDYSNMKEVEESQKAEREKRFFDTFPLNNEELDFIGLPNHPKIKIIKDEMFSGHFMKLSEYWDTFDPTIYDAYSAEELAEELYDDEGNEITVELTYYEAAELGLEDPHYFEMIEELNATIPSMRESWKNNKRETERLMIDFAERKIDELTSKKEGFFETCKKFEEFCNTEDGKITVKIVDTLNKFQQQQKPLRLTPAQEEKVKMYLTLNDDYTFKDSIIENYNKDINRAKMIIEKIKSQQKERKEAFRKAWKQER